jgi:hypothetical protein
LVAAFLVAFQLCALAALLNFVRQDMTLGRELTKKEVQYQALQDKYLSILTDTRKLEEDPDYQKQILKNEFGYVEYGEVPVVIVGPNDNGQSSTKNNKDK